MTTNELTRGAPNELDALYVVATDEDTTISRSVRSVQAMANIVVTLPSDHAPGQRHNLVASGGSITLQTSDGVPVLNGTFVPAGSRAVAEFAFLTSLQTFAWIVMGSGGGIGTGEILVDRISDVEALVDASLPNNIYARPRTVDQPFELEKTSTLPADGITVLNTLSSNAGALPGRWLRKEIEVPRWTHRTNWFVATSNATTPGDDENDGSALTPLLTLSEAARRLQAFLFTDYTIDVTGDVAATDTPRWSGNILSEGTPADQRQMLLNIVGKRIPVAGFPGGTIGTATATDVTTSPSTGLSQAMITDAGVANWTPYADPAVPSSTKLLVITSGPNAGLTAWTLFANPAAASSVLNGGVDPTRVRITNWQNTTAGVINGIQPGAAASAPTVATLSGQTYAIYDVSSYLSPNNACVGLPGRLQPTYKDFQFSTMFQSRGDGIVNCITTKHVGAGGGGASGSIFSGQNGALSLNGSLVHFSALGILGCNTASSYELNACGLVNVQVSPTAAATVSAANCVNQSGIVLQAFTAGGTPPNRPGVLAMIAINGAYGLGVYDAPTAQNAITVRRGGILATEGPLHGFGAVAGSLSFLHCTDGGTTLIKTGIIPTGTNTGAGGVPQQVRLDENATHTALQALESVTPGSQCGTAALVVGTGTAIVPAVITASSRIMVTRRTPAGAPLGADLAVPSVGRVIGVPPVGSFTVNAIDTATGATVLTDTSGFDWEVVNDPPIGVPLTTWAEWNAAIVPHVSGFARNAISQTDGSKIINFTGAN